MSSLIIISPFLPAQTPNTLRWNAIIKEWSKKDYGLHVITTKTNLNTNEEEEVKDFIFRAGYHTLYDLYVRLKGGSQTRNIPGLKENVPVLRNNFLNQLVDKTWRQWYWPDGTMLFVKPGIKLAENLYQRFQYKNLISVGVPFSCHIIARSLKERHPEINWIMDIQDPFSFSKSFRINNFSRYSNKNKAEEQKAFELADSIALSNERVMEKYNRQFTGYQSKMHVIPPLLEVINKTSEKLEQTKSSSITIAYYGAFYENVRSPESFLKLLEYLMIKNPQIFQKIKCFFIGEQTEYSMRIFQKYPNLKACIEFVPLLDRQNLYSFIREISFLLNFGNTTDYHLPSKVVEFLFFQKPLINFINRPDDSTADFIGDKIEILNLNVKDSNLENSARKFMTFVLQDHSDKDFSDEAVKLYGAKSIAQAYENLLI